MPSSRTAVRNIVCPRCLVLSGSEIVGAKAESEGKIVPTIVRVEVLCAVCTTYKKYCELRVKERASLEAASSEPVTPTDDDKSPAKVQTFEFPEEKWMESPLKIDDLKEYLFAYWDGKSNNYLTSMAMVKVDLTDI